MDFEKSLGSVKDSFAKKYVTPCWHREVSPLVFAFIGPNSLVKFPNSISENEESLTKLAFRIGDGGIRCLVFWNSMCQQFWETSRQGVPVDLAICGSRSVVNEVRSLRDVATASGISRCPAECVGRQRSAQNDGARWISR